MRYLFFCLAAFLIFSAAGGVGSMSLFKNDFEKRWEELFKDVKALNEYTATSPVELRNVKIEEHNIDGAIFTGANFFDVEWVSTSAKRATFQKTVFERCKFTQSNFSESTFTDVVFKDCEFIDSDINKSKSINVRFENCKFDKMGFIENFGDVLKFEHCYLSNSGLGDSTIDFEFKECVLDGVDLSVTKGGRKINILGGLLSEVDFGDSHFSDIILRRAKQGESPVRFNQASAKSITFEDVDMVRGVSLASVKAANVRISNSRMRVSFARSVIPKVSARDSEFFVFGLSEANMPHVTLVNSRIHYLSLWDGSAEEMIIQDSEINQIEGENFKGDHILWHNVTLGGEVNLTNAQVKDFRLTRLKRGPNLNLITPGSNLRFDFSAE